MVFGFYNFVGWFTILGGGIELGSLQFGCVFLAGMYHCGFSAHSDMNVRRSSCARTRRRFSNGTHVAEPMGELFALALCWILRGQLECTKQSCNSECYTVVGSCMFLGSKHALTMTSVALIIPVIRTSQGQTLQQMKEALASAQEEATTQELVAQV